MRACGALQIKAFPALNCPQQTSFSVHFLFSAACELWRRSPGSISPGWIWGRTHRRRPHSVSNPRPGRSPLPASRQAARPPTETIYSRPRKKLSAGRRRCPHRQGQYSCRPHSYSTPAVSRRWPAFFAPVSCGRVCHLACALPAAGVYMDFLSCVPPFVLRCRSPRKDFRRWHAPHNLGTTCPEVTSGHFGAVDKPYPIFKLRDKIEEKTGWEGYADTDRS